MVINKVLSRYILGVELKYIDSVAVFFLLRKSAEFTVSLKKTKTNKKGQICGVTICYSL